MQKLDLSGVTPIDKQIETFVSDRVRELARERLSHREIVDKLEEEGVDRTKAIRMVQQMARQREIEAQSRFTAPVIFLGLAIFGLIWVTWLAPSQNISHQFTMLKALIFSALIIAVPTLGSVVLYQHYEQIPILNVLLDRLFQKRRSSQADVIAIDEQFTSGQLGDSAYEEKLIQLMGSRRGRQHFLYMRNQKHFGLE